MSEAEVAEGVFFGDFEVAFAMDVVAADFVEGECAGEVLEVVVDGFGVHGEFLGFKVGGDFMGGKDVADVVHGVVDDVAKEVDSSDFVSGDDVFGDDGFEDIANEGVCGILLT